MSQYFLGIDLGGSNISAALLTPQGRIVRLEKTATLAEEGPAQVIARMLALIRSVEQHAKVPARSIAALGVGAPGIINITKGVVVSSPNLPGWVNIPLRRKLETALKKPVFVENDANVAAFGEKWKGAGAGYDDVIMFTVGTGVGGGIILGGEIYHGHCFAAGEVGHQTLIADGPLCGCGNRGCLEALASGSAIARAACSALECVEPGTAAPALFDLCGGDLSRVSAKLVFDAAARGDVLAQRVIETAAGYLGIGIANLVNVINPELIIIGGGVSVAGETYLKLVRAEVERRAMKDTFACVRIVGATLSDRAGVIGAAGIAAAAAANKGRRKTDRP